MARAGEVAPSPALPPLKRNPHAGLDGMKIMSKYDGPVTVDLEPDYDMILAQFAPWFGTYLHGQIEIGWTNPVDGALNQFKRFDIGDFDEAAAFVVETNKVPGQSVYYRPAIINEDWPAEKFVTDEAFLCSPGTWCDLDDKGAADGAKMLASICRPTSAVVTGETPWKRAQLYWRHSDFIHDPAVLRAINEAHARVLQGDTSVVNPTTLMRIAGCIAWPWKDGRIPELTRLVPGRVTSMHLQEVIKGFPVETPEAHKAAPAGDTDGLGLPGTHQRVDAVGELDAALTGHNWHNHIRSATAHWIQRGLSDHEIMLLVRNARLDGFTVADTDSQVLKLVQDARKKWDKPNPTFDDGSDEDFDEEPGPVPATAYLGTPPIRKWVIPDWLPQGVTSSLYGDGGVGKTLIAQQLASCIATGHDFIGLEVKQMPVLAVLCEDDGDELHRRQHGIVDGMGLGFTAGLDQLLLWSRVGRKNYLLTSDAQLTPFYQRVEKQLAEMGNEPKLLILDTLADLYAGSEIDRAQVSYFVKTTLGRIGRETNSTVLLLAHPSQAGLATGTLLSGSTAWNNAVRNRLTLDWIRGDDDEIEGLEDHRILYRAKANYAKAKEQISLKYVNGAFELVAELTATDTEYKRLKQVILEEIEAWCNKGRPLHESSKAPRCVYRHFFKYNDERVPPATIKRIVNALFDEGKIEERDGNRKQKTGIYPTDYSA